MGITVFNIHRAQPIQKIVDISVNFFIMDQQFLLYGHYGMLVALFFRYILVHEKHSKWSKVQARPSAGEYSPGPAQVPAVPAMSQVRSHVSILSAY